MTSSTMCEVYLVREVHGALSGSPIRAEWSRPPTASNNKLGLVLVGTGLSR